MTLVLNLSTGQELTYSCSPHEAVIAAYAQMEHDDYNTWDYEERYGDRVTEGKRTIACGDWTTVKENACSTLSQESKLLVEGLPGDE